MTTDQRQRPAAGPGADRPSLLRRPPMDPRIRQRRIEVRRDAGRRRLRVLLACLGVATVVGGAAAATRSPLLDVDRVEVAGAERTPRGQVVNAGGLGGRPAMTDVDTATVARRVEALPWVLDARVGKEWPGTVRVEVVERQAVAAVPADGGWAVVDAAGRVLEVAVAKPAGLPVLGAVPSPGRPGSMLAPASAVALRVAAALPAQVRARVADVAAVAGGEVELQLVPAGSVVRLGRPVDLEAKLQSLATLLTRADLAGVAVVDVRVPRAPVLTRR